MRINWQIPIPSKEPDRVAITYGDPADALIAINNYALYPLPESISNWNSIVTLLKTDHCYDVTGFYSRRKADLNSENARLLHEYNQRAYDAAKLKGGLIIYYQGVLIGNAIKKTNPNLILNFVPNCLSFCIWEDLQTAKSGAKIPEHKKASQMVSLWYDGFALVKYQVMLKQSNNQKMLYFQKVPYTKT